MANRFILSVVCALLSMSFNLVCAQELFLLDKKGAEVEYSVLDGKGNILSYSKSTVTNVEKKDAKNYSITYLTEAFDKNKKSFAPAISVTTEVVNGVTKQDPVASMGEAGVNAEFKGTYPEFPSELTVGEEFGAFEYTLKVNGMSSKASGKSKVIAKETVKTPAGSFDCFKVESETSSKAMMMTTKTKLTTWYAKGVGAVRVEVYDKKGNITSAQELVHLKK